MGLIVSQIVVIILCVPPLPSAARFYALPVLLACSRSTYYNPVVVAPFVHFASATEPSNILSLSYAGRP